MKKLLLLLAGGMVAASADAQSAKQTLSTASTRQVKTVQPQSSRPRITASRHSAARVTATCFTTVETFGSGTTSTLPSGWTAGVISGGSTWKWANTASTSGFSMGVMNSTSAADGWMIFDSDAIGAACGTCSPTGWLQSPAYNTIGQMTVRLSFENYYRKFNDSSSVWVGTDPGFAAGTYQVYPVLLNNNTPTNSSTANPSTVKINITASAANQPAVYIRFVSYGAQGGSYSWMIDNLCLSDVDPHDVTVSDGFFVMPDNSPSGDAYPGTIVTTPLKFVDSVYPLALLSNIGANAEAAVTSTAEIFQGTTSVYTDNYTYPGSLVADATDSVIGFKGYKPNAVGNYLCAINSTVPLDADATNSKDSVFFTVTDTTWAQNSGQIGGTYLYNATSSPATMLMQGTRFDLTGNVTGDTVSGFAVAFDDATDTSASATGTVSVQLYSVTNAATGWDYLGTSINRAVNTLHTGVWTDFRIDAAASGGAGQFILEPGKSYAAIVQISGVTKNIVINSTPSFRGSDGYIGFLGQIDESLNDGGTTFGNGSIATGNASTVPMVRMYTGPVPLPNSVKNVTTANFVGKAYPNPANTSVNIPFTTGVNADAKVTLTNAIGQVISTQQISTVGGKQSTASFNTSDLASGVYLFTVEANGQASTGRLSVAH